MSFFQDTPSGPEGEKTDTLTNAIINCLKARFDNQKAVGEWTTDQCCFFCIVAVCWGHVLNVDLLVVTGFSFGTVLPSAPAFGTATTTAAAPSFGNSRFYEIITSFWLLSFSKLTTSYTRLFIEKLTRLKCDRWKLTTGHSWCCHCHFCECFDVKSGWINQDASNTNNVS